MRILTMNIRHGGGRRVARIVSFIAPLSADTVVLTEYRANEKGRSIGSDLFAQGYVWQAASSAEPKENSVYIASRHRFVIATLEADSQVESHRVLVAQFAGFNVVG